ncbi:4824_t:CDS:2 [Diversispora eburnea]|uniref:4824_t:CDS:1 n=1 Tax=Diversispora eburnea TaxID=1213867 RepID=A0A9N9FRD8_9GLOM|nr:4824_t:CDS:2 [Diversispora eburnea]
MGCCMSKPQTPTRGTNGPPIVQPPIQPSTIQSPVNNYTINQLPKLQPTNQPPMLYSNQSPISPVNPVIPPMNQPPTIRPMNVAPSIQGTILSTQRLTIPPIADIPVITKSKKEPPKKDGTCLYCAENPADTDTDGHPSEFCSDECRRGALESGFATPCMQCKEFPRITGSEFCGWLKCRNLPLCLHCKVNRVHPRSLWCSKSCRNKTHNWQTLITEKSNQLCLNCNRDHALTNQYFCGEQCNRMVQNKAPCLFKLPANSQKYRDVTNQFRLAWKHPHKNVPEIESIWKIFCTSEMNIRYNIYREEVERNQKLEGKPFPKGDGSRLMSAGNEQRRFHGTKMSCFIGIKNGQICNDKSCAVCCIIKEGYKLRFVGTSSKSDDYNEGSLKNHYGTNYKVMLLNKVIVGKGSPLTADNMTLRNAPFGFDSVLGEPSATGNLNYDEVVVYEEAASIPQYLIVYKVP